MSMAHRLFLASSAYTLVKIRAANFVTRFS